MRDIDATEGQAPRNERKTFAELCDYFEKHYVKAAEYVEGRKVARVRSLGTAKGQLNVLRDYFGSCRLRSITHGDVRQFRAARLAQETRTKTHGDSLISLADENKRERILTREEEIKLLPACDTPQRAYLRGILICALDTGMRPGRNIFAALERNAQRRLLTPSMLKQRKPCLRQNWCTKGLSGAKLRLGVRPCSLTKSTTK